MDFAAVLRRRRMVRSFAPDPVDPAALSRIVDAARRGPSAGFSQGVEFVVVTDAATRETLGTWTPPGGGPQRSFVARAPAVVLVAVSSAIYTGRYGEADKQAVRGAHPDDDFWLVPYWHTDAGAAMMLLLLAAVNEGLAAGVAGVMGEAGQRRIREAIGMPAAYTAVALVAIGHAARDAAPTGSATTRRRRPRADVVHEERW